MEAEHLCMKCMKGVMTGRYCGYCGSERLTRQEMGNALPLRSILNGRYLVGRILGAGGFGITYLGYDLVNTRRIAIKEFMPDGLVNRTPGQTTVQITGDGEEFADSRQRFLDEARIIYRYRKNPHILQVYSLFEENGTAYYAMEFLEGSDLKHFLKQNGGRISWERLMPIAMQVIDAITVLHRDGVVHRDISPDNIFLSPQGKATLIDFGAARLFVAQRQLTVILKRKYAPIEQYQSKGKQGPWTDIYALAATMYHALTGILPPEATARAYRDEIKTFRQCGITLEPGGGEGDLQGAARGAGGTVSEHCGFQKRSAGTAAACQAGLHGRAVSGNGVETGRLYDGWQKCGGMSAYLSAGDKGRQQRALCVQHKGTGDGRGGSRHGIHLRNMGERNKNFRQWVYAAFCGRQNPVRRKSGMADQMLRGRRKRGRYGSWSLFYRYRDAKGK